MGTDFWKVVCDEHGIGSDCEYCGDNDAQLDPSMCFTTGHRAVSTCPARCSFDLEPSGIGAVRA
jgi:tubulin beta